MIKDSLNVDLGIDLDKIKLKFMSILTQRGIKENADYDDLAGPLLVCVIFGVLLLFVSIFIKLIQNNRKEKFNSGTSMVLVSQVAWEYTLSSI
jgi:uncharacterized membrane protein